MKLYSSRTLVMEFITAALQLCTRIQSRLPTGTDLDPLQMLVTGAFFRLIDWKGEVYEVGYSCHGRGARLWDGRRPREVPGVVDLDLGNDPDGVMGYEFCAYWVNRFAKPIGVPERPDKEIEHTCRILVREGVLCPSIDPYTEKPGSTSAITWCIPRLSLGGEHDRQRDWVANLGAEFAWDYERLSKALSHQIAPFQPHPLERLEKVRRDLEAALALYPKPTDQRTSYSWSELKIVDDADIFPQDT
jgi:hypothetical protein